MPYQRPSGHDGQQAHLATGSSLKTAMAPLIAHKEVSFFVLFTLFAPFSVFLFGLLALLLFLLVFGLFLF